LSPRLPAGLTYYEEELWMRLKEEWDPRMGLSGFSIHTKPLSETAKAAIRQLAQEKGMAVDFPELPDVRDPDRLPPIPTIHAVRTTPR